MMMCVCVCVCARAVRLFYVHRVLRIQRDFLFLL